MSDELTTVTNNVPRFTIDAWELTAAERADFDYLNWSGIDDGTDSATFFRYRGQLYDLGEFMRTPSGSDIANWHGYSNDTFFSGILVRYTEDCEAVIVARFYS